jgi:hypothetical protein
VETAALSSTQPTFVSLRRDYRKCLPCGGYFALKVNDPAAAEEYFHTLDLSQVASGASVRDEGDIVLATGSVDPHTGLPSLNVLEVYQRQ